MLKQVTVTFNYNPETDEVLDVKVVNTAQVRKTKTVKKKDLDLTGEPRIFREDNKLVFNDLALHMLDADNTKRIIVKWIKENDNTMSPIIGTDEAFEEEGKGNKVTKSGSISYRGKANVVLAEYGDEFGIEEYEDKIFKLINVGEVKEKPEPEEIKPTIIVDSDEEIDLDDLEFSL